MLFGISQSNLNAHEQQILRAARWLYGSVLIHGVLLLSGLGLCLYALVSPNQLSMYQTYVLFRFPTDSSTAFAFVLLLVMVNAVLTLVVTVGLLAREHWAYVAVWVLAIVNVSLFLGLGYVPAVITAVPSVFAGVISLRHRQVFRINPVLVRELRGQMRGARAFTILTVYLLLMSVFMLVMYVFLLRTGNQTSAASGATGRTLFIGLFIFELILIFFIVPALTTNTISGERETQTYDLMHVSLLTSPSLVIGKLESTLSYIILLLLAAIPLQSLAFLFGGISLNEVLVGFVILMISAITFGAVGLFTSAKARNTRRANLLAYTVLFTGIVLIPLICYLVDLLVTRFVMPNTVVWDSISHYSRHVIYSLNPVLTAYETFQTMVNQETLGFTKQPVRMGQTLTTVSKFLNFVVIYVGISVIMLIAAVRTLQKQQQST